MSSKTNAAERITDIIALLRPERTRFLPGSLTEAAANGDVERMALFVDRGANIDERSAHASPLAAACAAGRLDSVRWLIAQGATLDPPGAQISPLQSALGRMDCEVAALLLDAGLPIEQAAWGVIVAARLGNLEMLRWLLGRGVELDRSYARIGVLRDQAQSIAEKEGKAEIVRFLRDGKGASPPTSEPPRSPQLRRDPPRAVPSDRPRLQEEALGLIRAGGKASGRWMATGKGAWKRELLISFAAGTGNNEIVDALIEAGASPDLCAEGTAPPLTRAAEMAELDTVHLLLQRGASPNGPDGKNWLPLVGAVMSGDLEVVRALLDAGANAKAKPAGGRSLADHARGPYTSEIRSLLERASSPKLTSSPKKGKRTPR